MSKYQVKRPRHLGEIKRLDEQTRVPDLPAAAAAHEWLPGRGRAAARLAPELRSRQALHEAGL
jgi:hypothetical protein